MRRQRLTLMILEINIKYKILSKQFFLILEGGAQCLSSLPCGEPSSRKRRAGPPHPLPPSSRPGNRSRGQDRCTCPGPASARLCVPGGDSEDRNKERRAGVT